MIIKLIPNITNKVSIEFKALKRLDYLYKYNKDQICTINYIIKSKNIKDINQDCWEINYKWHFNNINLICINCMNKIDYKTLFNTSKALIILSNINYKLMEELDCYFTKNNNFNLLEIIEDDIIITLPDNIKHNNCLN